jgi:hypothetical protein
MTAPALSIALAPPICSLCDAPLGEQHDADCCWCCGSCIACDCVSESREVPCAETGYVSRGRWCTTHRRGVED